MAVLGHLAGQQALMALVGGGMAAAAPPNRFALAMTGLACLFGGIAAFYMVFALHEYAAVKFTPEKAHIVTAAFSLSLAMLSGFAAYLVNLTRKSRIEKMRDGLQEKIATILEDVAAELEDPVRGNPKLAVMMSAAAGYAVANRLT